jgi:lipopolysaccharide/colanic/teichoic acid biosynthesis glycosyltransferase
MRSEFDVKPLSHGINGQSQKIRELDKKTFRYLKIRRIAELFIFIVLLPPFILIILLCSIVLLFDMGGNIFFKQVRVGRNGLPFNIYKFRTFKDCYITERNNNNISKLGLFFRKHHLDELPQYFNVLKGEMSLIGPRPEVITEYLSFSVQIKDYKIRKLVPQGITGLAQIYIPNSQRLIDNIVKLKYDIEYIENISLKTDLKILMNTFIVLIIGRELKSNNIIRNVKDS